jgi:hypothetical protein
MKTKRLMILINLALLASFCSAGALRAARLPRIELLREIQVPGTSVLLSDLLPEGVPGALRKRTSEISLGAAAQPGDTRTLEQVALWTSIGPMPAILSSLVLPDRVVVSRETRSITLAEVFDAISKSLTHAGVNEWPELRLEDLLLQSQILVNQGDAGLQVLRAEVDTGLGRARFLLWPTNDPKVLPFIVTARVGQFPQAGLPRFGPRSGRQMGRPAALWTPAGTARQTVLISAGERATLVLHSDVLRMFADVISLEQGALGQRIRVRVLDTGKIFSAQVDGPAHLEMKF